MVKIGPVRGTQDLLDVRLEKKIIDQLTAHLLLHNFQQIQTPIIETLELFLRCVGQETDVVGKEMFLLEPRDEEKLCLRPELTAPTFRAFLNSGVQSGPWKVFAHGPMFRYERPQKGRWRQFEQFNVENIDAQDITHDIALISLLDRVFRQIFKLQTYILQLNFLGTASERQLHRAALVEFLSAQQQQICHTCQVRMHANPLRCFDCKVESCQQILEQAPLLLQFLTADSQAQWQQLQQALQLLDVNFVINPRLVRGLDYYNGVVFEFQSMALGAQNAFCGGGRYDLAIPLELRKPVPSIGAAIGIGRLALILRETGLQPDLTLPPLYLILPMTAELKILGLMLARQLQAAELRTDVLLDDCSLSNMLKKANRLQAAKVLIIGEQEAAQNQIIVKDMLTGAQQVVLQAELLQALQ